MSAKNCPPLYMTVQIGYVKQRRACCASSFHIMDAEGNNVLTIDGPCCCLACGCHDINFPVTTPSNAEIGNIAKRWGGFIREALTDADVFKIYYAFEESSCLQRQCCGPHRGFVIHIVDSSNNVSAPSMGKIGKITKRWSGCVREALTDADIFSVSFPMDLDVETKALLLAAALMIDFMEFEQSKQ
ncbi:unnamed protein product [Nippostrongylus brasiliensis]|uniref:Phospholipid scramblase n=1 Tax=Nippostrongylus brasiliensis TaxID=27835 RepID=A0A0N4YU30_NIPBR|nr:unnamed protein product [Nippostrongylus brasiliensis]